MKNKYMGMCLIAGIVLGLLFNQMAIGVGLGICLGLALNHFQSKK